MAFLLIAQQVFAEDQGAKAETEAEPEGENKGYPEGENEPSAEGEAEAESEPEGEGEYSGSATLLASPVLILAAAAKYYL